MQTVTQMFEELASQGFVVPAQQMDTMEMPTTLRPVPSFVTYGTPDLPVMGGVRADAGLEGYTQRNCYRAGFPD